MNSIEISKLQADYGRERDAREFSLGDTLDVKASVALAVIVFLAAQSDEFFRAGINGWALRFQYVAILGLVMAGIFSVFELFPRKYGIEGSLDRYDKWMEDLEEHYADKQNASELVLEQAIKGRYERTKQRVKQNIITNQRKSHLLYACFICTALAFAANLATLVTRLF